MKISFTSEFEINDEVYHKLNSETKGIIIEIRYNVMLREIEYLVSTAIGTRNWVDEIELTLEKPLQL